MGKSAEMTIEGEVGKALSLFAALLANPRPLSPELLKGWVLVLRGQGIRPEEIEPAAGLVLAGQTFFPTPADFLKFLRPPVDADVAAEIAWQAVRTCIERYGCRASLTALDLGGDEHALAALDRMGLEKLGTSDSPRAVLRAEYVRLYAAARAAGWRCRYLPGAFELDNRHRGNGLTPQLCGRPDWPEVPALAGPDDGRPPLDLPTRRMLAAGDDESLPVIPLTTPAEVAAALSRLDRAFPEDQFETELQEGKERGRQMMRLMLDNEARELELAGQ